MASQRSTNTMAEGLKRFLGQLADLKTMDDADMGFLVNMETQILDYIKGPAKAQEAAMAMGGSMPLTPQLASAAPGGVPQGLPSLGPGGMPPGGLPPLPPAPRPPGGLRAEPQMPPVDELRRMLAG